MSRKVYKIVTEKIIEKLKEGVVPWRRPFSSYTPMNWVDETEYKGINTLLLEPNGEYATFNQIKRAGGRVKKGEKSSIVVYWKWQEIEIEDNSDSDNEEKEDEETKKKVIMKPLIRYWNVFEINSQAEGLESKREVIEFEHNPIEEAESIIKGYENKPKITFNNNGAWYRPNDDIVNVPDKKYFENIHEYYSTMFHELIHSTGHKSRLNRKSVVELNPFGSPEYSREELIAEIGASMLCGVAGIENEIIDNSASYIQSWLKALENDHTLVVLASQQAQKASDYILGVRGDN